MNHFSLTAVLFAGAIGLISPTLSATTLVNQTYSGSYPALISGTLSNEDTVLLEAFTLPAASDFTASSTSYLTGGFEPNLILFNPAGIAIADGEPFGPAASTGLVGDSQLSATGLAAGTYILAASDFELNQSLTATNLSDGFTANYGDGVDFIDADGNTRTGNYSINVSLASSPAPEPATIWIAIPFLTALLIAARKQLVTTPSIN